ncbi:MAG: exo-alpha-sialidase [Solirubrobacteraceae bacterium]|nr:exo-alpha-sialidase [Solirubrobacteraceae bacterium]
MPRLLVAPLIVLTALACAGPAAAKPFVVSTAGDRPSVAVDSSGAADVVWDSVDQASQTSTTHFCRVPRNAASCASGSQRTFAPIAGDRDFAGPRVFVSGKRVVIVTSRCCSDATGPDGQSYGQHVFSFASGDAGATFDTGTWIGTQDPGVGSAFTSGGAFLAFGIAADGTALQSDPLAGFSGAPNTITPLLADSGGVGVTKKTTLVAFDDKTSHVYAGVVSGDPNAARPALKAVAKGQDTRVDSGPKGPDLLYRTPGSKSRYVVRRLAGTKLGPAVAVSEAGFPIFGNFAQDPTGRVHVVWQGLKGLTYRSSATSGKHFGKVRVLSSKIGYYDLVIAANAKGRAAVVYDGNGDAGRVGGFTTG